MTREKEVFALIKTSWTEGVGEKNLESGARVEPKSFQVHHTPLWVPLPLAQVPNLSSFLN